MYVNIEGLFIISILLTPWVYHIRGLCKVAEAMNGLSTRGAMAHVLWIYARMAKEVKKGRRGCGGKKM